MRNDVLGQQPLVQLARVLEHTGGDLLPLRGHRTVDFGPLGHFPRPLWHTPHELFAVSEAAKVGGFVRRLPGPMLLQNHHTSPIYFGRRLLATSARIRFGCRVPPCHTGSKPTSYASDAARLRRFGVSESKAISAARFAHAGALASACKSNCFFTRSKIEGIGGGVDSPARIRFCEPLPFMSFL